MLQHAGTFGHNGDTIRWYLEARCWPQSSAVLQPTEGEGEGRDRDFHCVKWMQRWPEKALDEWDVVVEGWIGGS